MEDDGCDGIDYKTFEFVKTLGKGTHGTVILAQQKTSKKKYAIKSIKKQSFDNEKQLSLIKREVEIMAGLCHPHIITVHDVCENNSRVTMTLEYASGGELFDYVNEYPGGLEDSEARRLFGQISSAVHYLHKMGIVHRDLKLENILLDCNRDAKIADFGLANSYSRDKLLFTYCGSPLYASPEIVKTEPYFGPEVDCWSLGVILYAMAFGVLPFDGVDLSKLRHAIINGIYVVHQHVQPLLRHLIGRLLEPITERRMTMKEVIGHPWLNDADDITVSWPYFNSPMQQASYSSPQSSSPGSLLRNQNMQWNARIFSDLYPATNVNYIDRNSNGHANPYQSRNREGYKDCNYHEAADCDHPVFHAFRGCEPGRTDRYGRWDVVCSSSKHPHVSSVAQSYKAELRNMNGFSCFMNEDSLSEDQGMSVSAGNPEDDLVEDCEVSTPVICEVKQPREISISEDATVVCDLKTSSTTCLDLATCRAGSFCDALALPRAKSEPHDLVPPRMRTSTLMFFSCYGDGRAKVHDWEARFRDESAIQDSLNCGGSGLRVVENAGGVDVGSSGFEFFHLERRFTIAQPDSLESTEMRIAQMQDSDDNFSVDSLDS